MEAAVQRHRSAPLEDACLAHGCTPAFGGQRPSLEKDVVAWLHRGNGCAHEVPLPHAQVALEPGCSLVICTHRRARSVKRFLDSLLAQEVKPDRLIVVDVSPDDETEQVIRNRQSVECLAKCFCYVRVSGALKGLPRQRNFALSLVTTDLVGFFDDDIILLPGCLKELIRTHRLLGDEVVGVGAYVENEYRQARLLWRLRRLLRMVSNLQPGSYHRSGISVPWSLLPPTEEIVYGQWLPGAAMMWRTAVAAEVGFREAFDGYAQGEDLDFSLRAGRQGELVVAGRAQFQHLHEPGGRPDYRRLGYMAIGNRYHIHQRCLDNRTWRDTAWFVYAWTIDTLLLSRHFLYPKRVAPTLLYIAGRLRAAFDLVRYCRTHP